jgi:hypothetical protein
VSFKSTTNAMVAQTQTVPFEQINDLFFKQATSDVRQTAAGSIFKGQLPAAGQCGVDRLSSKNGAHWGFKAYNYACNAETSVPWSDKAGREKIGVATRMGTECGNPHSCEVTLCKKEDTSALNHWGTAVGVNLETILGHANFRVSSVEFTVDCGIRKKLTVCPMKSGYIQKCAVWKSCGAASNPQPNYQNIVGAGGKAIWGSCANGNLHCAPPVSVHHPTSAQWAEIVKAPAFKARMTQTCAMQCGFF